MTRSTSYLSQTCFVFSFREPLRTENIVIMSNSNTCIPQAIAGKGCVEVKHCIRGYWYWRVAPLSNFSLRHYLYPWHAPESSGPPVQLVSLPESFVNYERIESRASSAIFSDERYGFIRLSNIRLFSPSSVKHLKLQYLTKESVQFVF